MFALSWATQKKGGKKKETKEWMEEYMKRVG